MQSDWISRESATTGDPSDALGGRLKLLKPSELTPAQKQAYDLVDTTMCPGPTPPASRARRTTAD